jgi:hypothetical protein
MTYRDALATAIDTLLAQEQVQAAKVLQRKLSRMKATALVPISDRDWCDCGERKRPTLNFCHECNRAFPVKLTIRFLTGTAKQSRAAFEEMKLISQTRLQVEDMRRAA